MSKKLKVYGGCFDGRNRLVTAAYSKREAFEQIKPVFPSLSYYTFNRYACETHNTHDIAIATAFADRGVFKISITGGHSTLFMRVA